MVTGLVFSTFFLGIFYRSASLYHPQRRAILHLKNQKRKVKDKVKPEDKSPVFDCTTLQSRTVQILLASTSVTALGINSPLVYLVSIIYLLCCGFSMPVICKSQYVTITQSSQQQKRSRNGIVTKHFWIIAGHL